MSDPNEGRDARRRRERQSRWAERLAAVVLIAKGYRVLEMRARLASGEIDVVAKRGRRLAFVEVKLRPSLAAAAHAVPQRQARRMHRAAAAWVRAHPAYAACNMGFDRFDVVSWHTFRHHMDVLQPSG